MIIQRILVGVCLAFSCLVSNADTTSDILDSTIMSGSYTPCSGTSCWAGYSGGQTPSWNGYTARWGYGGGWLNWTVAMNQILKENGIQVDGYQYSWVVKNANAGRVQSQSTPDHLLIDLKIYDNAGNEVYSKRFDYSQTISNWTTFSGTDYFKTPFDPGNIGNINISAIGDDHGNWAGWYGPEFDYSSSSINFIYSSDPCYNNQLYAPECPGYAEAYAKLLYDQNCAANPLYDTGCPGYSTAYFNQQCSFDALYNVGCPGYAEAYFNQQCTLDPLYDTSCSGYEVAYFAQQCTLDPLYNVQCPGYAVAYYNQQCKADALYDVGCPGYKEAYATKMILDTPAETVAVVEQPVAVADPITSLTTVSSTGNAVVDSVISAPVVVASIQQETVNGPIQDTSSTVDEPLAESGGGDDNGSEGESEDGGDTSSDGSTESKSSSDSKREKMKKAMTEKAMALADDMSNAATVEAQKAVQAQVLAVMSYVPGFGSYGGTIGGGSYSDAQMYAPTTVPESRRGLRNGLAQQLLHEKLVESQYAR